MAAIDNDRRTCAGISTMAAAVYVLVGKSEVDLTVGAKSQANTTTIQAGTITTQMPLTLPPFAAVEGGLALAQKFFIISDTASDQAAVFAIFGHISTPV